MIVPLGEKRAYGPVNDSGNQDLSFIRTSFALKEAAGYLTRSECHLLIVDSERKKIHSLTNLFEGNDRNQDDSIPILYPNRTLCLTGHIVCFQGYFFPCKIRSKYLTH